MLPSPDVPRRRLPLLEMLGLALAALPGCKEGKAIIKGTVTFAGKRLQAGTVNFVTADNRTGSATINLDGTYTMADAPVGDVKVFIGVPRPPRGTVSVSKPPRGVGEMK